jgi:hypothetical protein
MLKMEGEKEHKIVCVAMYWLTVVISLSWISQYINYICKKNN